MSKQSFINEILPYAKEASQQTGVPTSVILAQAGLESRWGKSGLVTGYNNVFGIKGPGVVMKTKEYEGGKYVTKNASFKTYGSIGESVLDYVKLISGKRYANVRSAGTPEKAAVELKKAGYATDAVYAELLINTINSNNLKQYDTGGSTRGIWTSTETTGSSGEGSIPSPEQDLTLLGTGARFVILLGLVFVAGVAFMRIFPKSEGVIKATIEKPKKAVKE